MEDRQWEQSAKQWQDAYKLVKADRDKLLGKLQKITTLAHKCERGCDCEYDHRCDRCQALLDLKREIFNDS